MGIKRVLKNRLRDVSRLLTIVLVLFGLAPVAAHSTTRASVADRVSPDPYLASRTVGKSGGDAEDRRQHATRSMGQSLDELEQLGQLA